jgi:hypothetical protein
MVAAAQDGVALTQARSRSPGSAPRFFVIRLRVGERERATRPRAGHSRAVLSGLGFSETACPKLVPREGRERVN